jgi:DNA-binding NtrC family response regulator
MTEQRSVLVVDDDAAMREMLTSLLAEAGIRAQTAKTAEDAMEALRNAEFDAVLSDIRMPGKSGYDLIGELRELRPETPVILMTAFGSLDSAVEALRAGAYDYITKPFKRPAVLASLERAFERRELERENRRLRRAVDHTTSFGDLIGTSPPMRDIFALIRKVADSQASVLITGESGTGKEVVARTIHFTGARGPRPFVPVNCTAIPEGLLESELFGHVRGAFTGAHTSKRGLFEEANGGTLFLDEIGDMGPSLQAKLLRVLQDREIRRVGGTQSIKVDVRIITATNKELHHEIEEGRFRKDLFYRLNVIPVDIPPLRERPEDIPILAEAFLRKHAGDEERRLTPSALQRLLHCHWEGNARELENVIERGLALTDGPEIRAEDLPLPDGDSESPVVKLAEGLMEMGAERQLTLRELEDLYIAEILRRTGGNKVRAARVLGINRRTLYRREERPTRKGANSEQEETHDSI